MFFGRNLLCGKENNFIELSEGMEVGEARKFDKRFWLAAKESEKILTKKPITLIWNQRFLCYI